METKDDTAPSHNHIHTRLATIRARLDKEDDPEDLQSALRRMKSRKLNRHPTRFGELGNALRERFDRLKDARDLDDAIWAYRYTTQLLEHDHERLSDYLDALGRSLTYRFNNAGFACEDIDDAISARRRAVAHLPDGHPHKPGRLHNLSVSLSVRFTRFGELQDLQDAISGYCDAVDVTLDDCLQKHARLSCLAQTLLTRFTRLGKREDLDDAVTLYYRVIDLSPNGHPDAPLYFCDLGNALNICFDHFGDPTDLEGAISAHRLAVNLATAHDEHPEKLADLLDFCGNSLVRRFDRFGALDDLSEAIDVLRRAVKLTTEEHASYANCLSDLGSALLSRFRRLGELVDVDEAVMVQRQAVALRLDGHLEKPYILNALGFSLYHRFEQVGELRDIEDALSVQYRAVELMPNEHVKFPMILSELGNSLAIRFRRLGELKDLDDAIFVQERAVDLAPDGHPDKPTALNNLAGSYHCRFEQFERRKDIDDAILTLERALDLASDDQPDKLDFADNLGYMFCQRFALFRDVQDIETSITLQRVTVESTSDGHAGKPNRLNGLGLALQARFDAFGESKDVDDAISAHLQAVQLTADGDQSMPTLHTNLGMTLSKRFPRSKRLDDFNGAVSSFLAATEQPLVDPRIRLIAAQGLVDLITKHPTINPPESLLAAHSRVLNVLPEIIWIGYALDRRYHESSFLGGLVTSAVAAAIDAGALLQAIEWLEEGRSLVWSQVLTLRAPLHESLNEVHPDLASRLQDVQKRLQSSSYAYPQSTPGLNNSRAIHGLPSLAFDVAADRHRQLVLDYEQVVKEICARPGFEDFMRPKTKVFDDIEGAIDSVVFLNVAPSRCDALILIEGEIKVVELPNLTQASAENMRALWSSCLTSYGVRLQREDRAMGWSRAKDDAKPSSLHRVLSWLWTSVVQPILHALNMLHTLVGTAPLPHITWCPTGALTQLPLHAAGTYDGKGGPRAYNFFVSSYTPSLSALQRCRETLHARLSKASLLLLAQSDTPRAGLSPLESVAAEVACIRSMLPDGNSHTFLEDARATVDAALAVIDRHSWLHIACHGSQKQGDPSQSAFELYDGPLSLSALMATTSKSAELAFLSACQTATGDKSNPEESAHLAAGMLAVGFKGVVATMWSIGDADAPVIVEAYYRKLLELRSAGALSKGETGAAYALHEAVKVLRETVGEDDLISWVPYVHFGV